MGFGATEYTVMESMLSLEVSVELLQGVLDIPLVVEVGVQPRPTDLASGLCMLKLFYTILSLLNT